MTQDRVAPGVYDSLETVLYFKYCITPHPLESQENALDEINIKNMCHKVWHKRNFVPQVPQMWHKMWHNLGCMGEIQYNYIKYVPQNVVQTKLCATCTTNEVQNVVHIVVQTRLHGGKSILKISQQSFFRYKNRGLGAKNQKSTSNISKLEYFEAFCQKIQKLKIFVKKPKNHILGGQN